MYPRPSIHPHDTDEPSPLLGTSRCMRAVRRLIEELACVPWPVRIEGPTGCGKNVAASVLHDGSRRAGRPFVHQSLTLIAPDLAIAQLLGWAPGAFTGATAETPGAFERAHGGTLFLDEIAEATAAVQGALLQLLESHSVVRLGEQRARRVDVRILFATNVDLEREVGAGRFRPDLYHRLGHLVIRMPALCQHPDDIPRLAEAALQEFAQVLDRPPPTLGPDDLARMAAYPWPGNVRELRSAMQHVVVLGELPEFVRPDARRGDWHDRLLPTLASLGGNRAATARALGVSRNSVHRELRRLARGDRRKAAV